MQIKQILITAVMTVVIFIAGCTPQPHIPKNAKSMWLCNASDARQGHWFQYSPTRVEAANLVRNRCERSDSYRSTCVVSCFPPKRRWHCVSADARGHTWYWNSGNKVKAVKGARRLCIAQSDYGRCRVLEKNCSRT